MENTEKNLSEIATKVAENAKQVKSIKSVKYNEERNRIEIECVRYYCQNEDGVITDRQYEFLKANSKRQSNTNLSKLNKWCASVCIGAIKEFQLSNTEIYIAC